MAIHKIMDTRMVTKNRHNHWQIWCHWRSRKAMLMDKVLIIAAVVCIVIGIAQIAMTLRRK